MSASLHGGAPKARVTITFDGVQLYGTDVKGHIERGASRPKGGVHHARVRITLPALRIPAYWVECVIEKNGKIIKRQGLPPGQPPDHRFGSTDAICDVTR
jgi:hypothetical protein